MGRHQTQPLPWQTVSDLLAIARGLCAMRRDAGADLTELERLERAAQHFALALDFAKSAPNSVGHRASWDRAQLGLEELAAALAGDDVPVSDFVRAWSARLKG